LLTGEKPFTGESTTTIMYKVLREEPVPPSELNLSLAPALDSVMKKALAKAPDQRFQSGHEFAEALKAAVVASTVSQVAVAPAIVAPIIPPAAATPVPLTSRPRSAGLWAVGAAAIVALMAGGYILLSSSRTASPPVAQGPVTPAAPAATSAPAAAVVATPMAPPVEAGTMVISAVGLVDPQDARFKGDLAAAQAEARNDVKRQLVEKAVALYVDQGSLDSNRPLIEQKLLSNSGAFIRTVLQEGAASDGKAGLVEMQARAVVNLREVQKSLNQLSREERVEFIRNKGDPRISIRIAIANPEGNLARDRSQLAENVVKERIKSFGFRVWAAEGDTPASGKAQAADFAIRGEVKVKQLSMKLAASGLTITKTALTSWTLKAIDVATGEEVYLSTRLPSGQSWASEDQALADIGKLVGDEFSRNFFLQHFNFRTQKTSLIVTGLPVADSPLVLRELRGMRAVLDAQAMPEAGRFELQLPEGSAPDLVQEAVLRPLNLKLGQACFALAGTSGSDVTVSFAAACATPQLRTKLESGPPAGWPSAPAGKIPVKSAAASRTTA
ncbi:MAG: hypothetical protein ABIU58_08740, partial [Ramlibacter sp.]